MMTDAIRLRKPAMVRGCQSMILMNRPARLQRMAGAAIASIPEPPERVAMIFSGEHHSRFSAQKQAPEGALFLPEFVASADAQDLAEIDSVEIPLGVIFHYLRSQP